MEESKWFNKSIEEAEKILETNIQNGLTENDVKTKREKYGVWYYYQAPTNVINTLFCPVIDF